MATFYEFISGDTGENTGNHSSLYSPKSDHLKDFAGMPEEVFLKIAQLLEKQGFAKIVQTAGEYGIKFL